MRGSGDAPFVQLVMNDDTMLALDASGNVWKFTEPERGTVNWILVQELRVDGRELIYPVTTAPAPAPAPATDVG